MKHKVAIRSDLVDRKEDTPFCRQNFLYPGEIFSSDPHGPSVFWTCVRTRPRWEKKFVRWLIERRMKCFLPVFSHETVSGRKRRVSELPLFPGFVFVAGNRTKKELGEAGHVVYVLQPRGEKEADQLHRELRNIWNGLTCGLYVAPVQNLAAGESCRIIGGPLQGVDARFERMGRGGRLVLQVEMMGGGIAVEVPAAEVEVGS